MGHDKFSDFKINIPKDEEYLGIDDIANVEPILKKLPELFFFTFCQLSFIEKIFLLFHITIAYQSIPQTHVFRID